MSADGSTAIIRSTALLHGRDLLTQGFTVSQVVHGYGDVCQSITDLALETDAPISTEDFRTLNRCLDDAIAGAVTEYRRAHDESGIEAESESRQRMGFFAHELRNLSGTALMAFEMLKTGNVGVTGSTGTVLHRSLLRLASLISRSLVEIRLTQGVQHSETILVSGFIDDVAAEAALKANAKGITLVVQPVEDGVELEGDRHVLAAVVQNLLQNGFKFTRPHTSVTLRVRATTDRVLIEVEDECGGLPTQHGDELFRPFEQRSADRSGLGLGLAFCRWAVELSHGAISTRNLPDKGCVFTVDLPRCRTLTAA